ncbi:MAG: SbcC/MukB-like Walker B domain-containing protein [Planctomycetota bacterium]|nr:SbcC/MukB-like Walker B domain-containing protein [Planctomycetota bacterium]
MENLGWTPNARPGYRLKKLEVTNWGTFDSTAGQVYQLAAEGRSALLVGQNGSGKSTLVDTLLTLLVQPGVRNYNVAAGAKKRERDERTYIRGACGRSSDEEAGSVTDYLRPDDKHYSVLLACFKRESTGDAFTVVQVLQILGDGDVDKTYAYADEEKSIAEDLSGLTRSEKIKKQLVARGFKATTKYSEYMPWIARKTSMRSKALDVFNQTVAVKDIQSLNRFIRDHMLEGKPWKDRIESLLSHFLQLSQAHQSLVRARRQIELLEPIETAAEKLEKLNAEQSLYQQQLDATDSYFKKKTIDWLRPKVSSNRDRISKAQGRKVELEKEIEALEDTQRYIRNEIDNTGGERLRQLPLQLESQQTMLAAKKRERSRLQSALKLAGIETTLNDEQDFANLPGKLGQVQEEISRRSTEIAAQRLDLARNLTEVRKHIDEDKTQLEVLQQQPGNLPGWLAEVRAKIAQDLGLDNKRLPFACELISVAESEGDWQSAIELVLRPFALTLLVPEEHYRAVSSYVENHRLTDQKGRGQKLVYSRVQSNAEPQQLEQLHSDSLVYKLGLQEDHELAGWIRAELHRRFDFRCCSTLEQFQRAPGLALTQQRHVKYGSKRHEKDDRAQAMDSKRFVLGWDNAARLAELHTSLQELRQQESAVLDEIHQLETHSKRVSKQLAAVDEALAIDDYELIDTQRHKDEIRKLDEERKAIEQSNDTVRVLRERLEEAAGRRQAAQKERDEEIAIESNMLRESEHSLGLLEKYENLLAERQTDGSLTEHEVMFEQLDLTLGDRLQSISDLLEYAELQNDASRQLQESLNKLSMKTDPLRADIIRAMQKFLSDSPEEKNDLRADLMYLDGFLGLLDQLRKDDLPKYERRFQDRLNEKVIQEIGVFHAALQCEKQEIASKIGVLNESLEQLEYRAGTFMRLEPRDASDREIKDFQALLRECLDDQFDGDTSADEARFKRIEKLIRRLREEERWRDKVTDVRRWFDFAARELDAVSGEERSCYEDSAGQSGGEKAKLAFTILVAAIAYQFDIDPSDDDDDRFHFVVVDEMFSKVDDRYAEYALQLFEKFGLQLLIVAPLDAKARVTEPYVGCYLHTVKNEKSRTSEVISMTATEYAGAMASKPGGAATATRKGKTKSQPTRSASPKKPK